MDAPARGLQAARHAYNAGFLGLELVTAVAVSHAESNWNPDHIEHTARGVNIGLWAIGRNDNPSPGQLDLRDAADAARAAYILRHRRDTGWCYWPSWIAGLPTWDLAPAQRAVDMLRSLGVPIETPGRYDGADWIPDPAQALYPRPGDVDPAPVFARSRRVLDASTRLLAGLGRGIGAIFNDERR